MGLFAAEKVPAEPFKKILDEAVARHSRPHVNGMKNQPMSAEQLVCRAIWPERPLNSAERRLFDLRNGMPRHDESVIGFDEADRIVISLLGPDAWRSEPELREIWESVDLAEIDRVRPCCDVEKAA